MGFAGSGLRVYRVRGLEFAQEGLGRIFSSRVSNLNLENPPKWEIVGGCRVQCLG